MDKLRSTYKKYQQEVYATKPRYVASEKVAKYVKLAEKEIQTMQNSNNFEEIGEAVFYKEKFEDLQKIASNFQKKKILDQQYHRETKRTLLTDFAGNEMTGGAGSRTSKVSRKSVTGNEMKRSTSKSPLKDFFDEQDARQSKKVSFSNIVSSNDTPLRMGLRSVSRTKMGPNRNELKKLQDQNRRLRDRIDSSVGGSHIGGFGGNEDDKVRSLHDQVRSLDEQNRRLRDDLSKASQSSNLFDDDYDPYNLKVRENNITKINTKNLYQSERMSQFGSGNHDDSFFKSKRSNDYENRSVFAGSDINVNHRGLGMGSQDMLNESSSTIQSHFLNLERSELNDPQKHQICREKIAFFKKSMVLVKERDYEIAYKRSDFNSAMDRLRLILYINNKDNRSKHCSFNYDYDRDDFDVNVKRSISTVESRNQGREEIEVVLKNSGDLGSLITAQVTVGEHTQRINIPTLFIDFNQEYKYQFQDINYIERKMSKPLTINPMTQFSSIQNASNVLDLNRQFQQKYEVAKLYGKSKACEGVVKLTWKSSGKLKIETCEEWRTLMGYLFLNAEETIHY